MFDEKSSAASCFDLVIRLTVPLLYISVMEMMQPDVYTG
jgi:hypothetical protein